jgi:tetratricopeptide (TPR) repeat protein
MEKLKRLKNNLKTAATILFFCMSLFGTDNQNKDNECVLVSEYYFVNGEYDKSLKMASKCDDNEKKYAIKAMSYYKKGDMVNFKKVYYDKYLKYRQKDSENGHYALALFIMRGNYCLKIEDWNCALKSFESIKMLAPSFAEAYYNIAVVTLKTPGLKKVENCDDITFHFRKAFDIDRSLEPTKEYYSLCGEKNKEYFLNRQKNTKK